MVLTSCQATTNLGTRYQKRISGPLLDRIDIHAEVPRVDFDKLADDRLGETSSSIRERVESARDKQRLRFEETELGCNADMGPSGVRIYCGLDSSGRALIRQAITTHGSSLSSSFEIGSCSCGSFGG